jgi:hypothetical protein
MKDRLLNSCALLINELIQNTQEKKVFTIPLVHFSYIYIDESKKCKGYFVTNSNWRKISKELRKLKLDTTIVQTKRERIFFIFLHYGVLGHYLARKLSKLLK